MGIHEQSVVLNSKEAVLNAIADEVSVPSDLDRAARNRYASIGDWLLRPESGVRHLKPRIYAQGSFQLGTAVRPTTSDGAYDADVVVCLTEATRHNFSQAELKRLLGTEIQAYAVANGMRNAPKPSRRCWTIEYADRASFHIDLLPCVPAEELFRSRYSRLEADDYERFLRLARTAVAITDDKHPGFFENDADWLLSNPKGFAAWFREQQREIFEQERKRLADAGQVVASIEQIPIHAVRTPLQTVLKLLKRHRDVRFEGRDHAPISVIIATLAGQAYAGQSSVCDTLASVLPRMYSTFLSLGPEPRILNPSLPQENFADKWVEQPAKRAAFGEWLEDAQSTFGSYLTLAAFDEIPDALTSAVSTQAIDAIRPRLGGPVERGRVSATAAAASEASRVRSEGAGTRPWSVE